MSGPEETGTDTKQGSSEDGEAHVLGMRVAQERRSINTVTETTKGQCDAEAEPVGNSAGEETDDCKSAVQSCVGMVLSGSTDLTTASKTTEGIEHTRAHEADYRDHEELDLG